MIGEFFRGFFRDAPTADKTTRIVKRPESDLKQDVERSTLNEDELKESVRSQHAQMSDKVWMDRIISGEGLTVEVPNEYQWNSTLIDELAHVPPEGMKKARQGDVPPPPFKNVNGMIIPKSVYSNGLVWNVGEQIGRGGFGKVFEVAHCGGEGQRKRVVKIMCFSDDKRKRETLWNEIGANMVSGDFVGSEVLQNDGETWVALILERHSGETLKEYISCKKASEIGAGFDPDVNKMFKVAVMIRSVVHVLRRMHALGWTHQDIKPANVIFNTRGGEEFLSRPIDYGVAMRKGNIRTDVSDDLVGTPLYMLPEVHSDDDVDFRIRDYWGIMVSSALAIGLITEKHGDANIGEIIDMLQDGKLYRSCNFDSSVAADAFYNQYKLSEPQVNFVKWLFQFIRPLDDIGKRQAKWVKSGVTTQEGLLNDDRFVRDLEGHVLALGGLVDKEDLEGTLQMLQEFPSP